MDLPSGKNVVYLTGASGFLGTMIVKLMQEDATISKVYCPTREKKAKTGRQRFEELFGDYDKAAYINIQDDLPNDTTHVILNAYNTRFSEDLGKKLDENVSPILKLLDQCAVRQNRIQGICVVSTAYCQPPAPYTSPEGGRVPFLLGNTHTTTPFALYAMLIQHYKNGAMKSHDALVDLVCPHDYFKNNEYAFSKHIMEHVIREKYADLPIAIVRPSMVAPTRDGRYGHESNAGVPLFMTIVRHPVMLAPRSEGLLNFVFVEDCAADCLRGVLSMAKPAVADEQQQRWHAIRLSTGRSDGIPIQYLRKWAPPIRRVHTTNESKQALIRKWELLKVRVGAGKHKAKLIEIMYESYDPFMSQTWTFDESHDTGADEFVASGKKYQDESILKEQAKKNKKKNQSKSMKFKMMRNRIVRSLS